MIRRPSQELSDARSRWSGNNAEFDYAVQIVHAASCGSEVFLGLAPPISHYPYQVTCRPQSPTVVWEISLRGVLMLRFTLTEQQNVGGAAGGTASAEVTILPLP